jgi:predicted RNase H-like nuclease
VRVAGVDGCRRGWVLATVGEDEPRQATVEVVADFCSVVSLVDTGDISYVAVDMPIGLPDGPRACDRAARTNLGPRRASVFSAPPRAALGATTYHEALHRSRAVTGKGLSKQAFHLLAKIAELDGVLRPDLYDRVVEAHPELAFARLAGAPLTTRKRDPSGRAERMRLLVEHVADLPALVDHPPPGARADDVLDALVLTLTAARLRLGTAELLGDGARDGRGRPQQIAR